MNVKEDSYISAFADRHWRWMLALILLAALAVRAIGIPHGIGTHPDERHMVMVVERLSWNNLNPKSFAYGSFTYYLVFFVSEVLGYFWPWLKSYDGLFYVGRSVCTFAGVLTVYATFALAQEVFKSRLLSLIAAWFLAFNFLHIQLSRYFTSDVILTGCCVAALLSIVKISEQRSLRHYIFTGIWIGLAIACKIAGLYLLPCFGLAVLLSFFADSNREYRPVIIGILSTLLTMCIIFFVASPFAVLDFSTFYAQNMEQIRMVRGEWRPPYIIQFERTTSFFYPLKQIGNYTVSWLILGCSFVGLMLILIRKDLCCRGCAILWMWIVLFFILTAGMPVKFPRYLLPISPDIMIFAALTLNILLEQGSRRLCVDRSGEA